MDAASLFAEAMMDVTPWNYWTKDGKPTEYTDEIINTLEAILKRAPNRPGANHFYIHAVEGSPDPDRSVPSADLLTHLVPGANHLVHMPGHIYWRVGRYHDVITSNQHAIHSDESGANNLHLAGHILAADLASAQEDTDKQIAELEQAVHAEDARPYIELPAC